VEDVAQIDPSPAGQTAATSAVLEPGTYVIISNVSGHYQQGMHTTLTVE
jgi:uncharacterized cupredoxin-like copper-binding protein